MGTCTSQPTREEEKNPYCTCDVIQEIRALNLVDHGRGYLTQIVEQYLSHPPFDHSCAPAGPINVRRSSEFQFPSTLNGFMEEMELHRNYCWTLMYVQTLSLQLPTTAIIPCFDKQRGILKVMGEHHEVILFFSDHTLKILLIKQSEEEQLVNVLWSLADDSLRSKMYCSRLVERNNNLT